MQLKNNFYYIVNKNIYLSRNKNIEISMLTDTVEYIILIEINFFIIKIYFSIISQNRTSGIA